MSDSVQESQKRHLSKIRPHGLGLCDDYSGEGETNAELARRSTRNDDSDVDRCLLHGHSALRRGSPQSGVPMVSSTRSGWQGSRSLDVLKEPAWPLSRERSVVSCV